MTNLTQMDYRQILLEEKTQLEADKECLLKMLGDICIKEGNGELLLEELDATDVKLTLINEELKKLDDTNV